MLPSLSAARYSARHDQRRASPQKPAGELWLGKICQQDTVGGGTRVGDMSMRESTRWQAAAARIVVLEVVVVVVVPGAAAGYQCGFCVDAAGPAVQVLGHRVALC